MNHCGIQQSALVCPKPRRLGQLNSDVNDPVRPFRWYFCNQQEGSDSMAAADILEDIILIKGSYHDAEQATGPHHVASSPPFFCGSPPSRVSNPVVMDARFGDEQHMARFRLEQSQSPPPVLFHLRQHLLTGRVDASGQVLETTRQ